MKESGFCRRSVTTSSGSASPSMRWADVYVPHVSPPSMSPASMTCDGPTAREAKPGVSVTDATVTTKPGEIPAGAVESQVTVTAAISAVDAQKGTLMITSLQDDAETVKARNPNMLAGVKAGDLVQLTYTRALAVALDKPAGR